MNHPSWRRELKQSFLTYKPRRWQRSLSLITQGEKPPPAAPPESLQASLSPLHYRVTPAIGTPSSHWAGIGLPHLYTLFWVPFLKGPQKTCFFHFYQLPLGFRGICQALLIPFCLALNLIRSFDFNSWHTARTFLCRGRSSDWCLQGAASSFPWSRSTLLTAVRLGPAHRDIYAWPWLPVNVPHVPWQTWVCPNLHQVYWK